MAKRVVPPRLDACVGAVVSFSPIALDMADTERLNLLVQPHQTQDARHWRGFVCRFENGEVDHIAVHVGSGKEEAVTEGFLSTIWPVLREDCLREIQVIQAEIADDALLGMIASRIDLGVLVVNAKGIILRANSSAKYLLKAGNIIVGGHGGVQAIDDVQSRILRNAIAACAAADPASAETVVMLETASRGPRVPVTLTRFLQGGHPTNLVTLLLPSPPDPRRVEMLAKEMGLTTAEARVAVQMQQGLSNREAAQSMGLKEQSFSTYAKRVLSKLNANSRAEVAQLLTWQAHGGRIS
ncbi:MAG: helix-turn-helix transcriptional regulator [Paracoccaceae bacterium]